MSLGNKREYLHSGNLRYTKLVNCFKSLMPHQSGRLNFFPRRYTLDPSSACNLKCAYCFHSHYDSSIHLTPKIMPFSDFNTLFLKIWKYAMMIELYNWGEPLLNPELPRMLSCISGKGIRTRLSSNLCASLQEDYLRDLARSGLYRLTAAVDGHTQEIYEKYRAGGNLEMVIRNTRLLMKYKKQFGLPTPILSFRMLVFEWNHQFVNQTREFAESLGFEEFYAVGGSYILNGQKVAWDMQKNKWIELDSKFKGFTPEKAEKPCSWLFSTILINPDGSTFPCCYSADRKSLHLSLLEHSLDEVWNSEQYINSRLFTLGLSKDRSNVLPVCAHCRLL